MHHASLAGSGSYEAYFISRIFYSLITFIFNSSRPSCSSSHLREIIRKWKNSGLRAGIWIRFLMSVIIEWVRILGCWIGASDFLFGFGFWVASRVDWNFWLLNRFFRFSVFGLDQVFPLGWNFRLLNQVFRFSIWIQFLNRIRFSRWVGTSDCRIRFLKLCQIFRVGWNFGLLNRVFRFSNRVGNLGLD